MKNEIKKYMIPPEGSTKHDVLIALIWAVSFIVPMFYFATNWEDLSEVKVTAISTLLASSLHAFVKLLRR